jgi:hypothetical protein
VGVAKDELQHFLNDSDASSAVASNGSSKKSWEGCVLLAASIIKYSLNIQFPQ